jgi:uncharacterized LabA/DUF88 family protein
MLFVLGMDKAIVFIDGGYYAKVRKNVFGEAPIKLDKFSENLCKRHGCERIRTYFYDCMPYQSNPPTAEEKWRTAQKDKFVRSLKQLPRFEFVPGRLQKIGNEFNQKGVDVLFSVDLVTYAYSGRINKAILVTGDSDFVPAIKAAKDTGTVVILYYSRGPGVYAHDELLEVVDEKYEITSEIVDNSL